MYEQKIKPTLKGISLKFPNYSKRFKWVNVQNERLMCWQNQKIVKWLGWSKHVKRYYKKFAFRRDCQRVNKGKDKECDDRWIK